MQTVKHYITLKTTLVAALLIMICAQFNPMQSNVQAQYNGDYYEYGPFRAYYDTAK